MIRLRLQERHFCCLQNSQLAVTSEALRETAGIAQSDRFSSMSCLQSVFSTSLLAKEVAVAGDVDALHQCGGKEHVVYRYIASCQLQV